MKPPSGRAYPVTPPCETPRVTAIAELEENRTVEGVYAVSRKERLRTRNGSTYLALEGLGAPPDLLHAVACHHDARAARTAEAAVLYHANQLDAVAATRPVPDA